MAPRVGWVVRSDTHQLSEYGVGYRVAPPIYGLSYVSSANRLEPGFSIRTVIPAQAGIQQ